MDYLISLFFIPILSGYLILIFLPHFRHTHKRLSGTNLVFYSLLIGLGVKIFVTAMGMLVPLVFAALDIPVISLPLDFIYKGLNSTFAITTEDFFTAFLAIVYAFIFTTLNTKPSFRGKLELFEFTFEGALLEKTIEDSLKNWRFLMITLKSRKVYIGVVRDIPNLPSEHGYYIRIVPAFSGYRRPGTLHFKKENDYGLPFFIMDQLQYMDEGDSFVVEVKGDKEEAIEEHMVTYKLAKQIDEQFGLLLNCNDIETIAYWIPDLYEWQNTSSQASASQSA